MTLDRRANYPSRVPRAAFAILAIALPWGAIASPIEQCLARVAADRIDVNTDLCAACPNIRSTIRHPTYTRLLDRTLACPVKLAELADLAAFERDVARRPSAKAPATNALKPVLADLALKPEATAGWWDRFRRWFRHWLTDDEGRYPAWLEDWLASLSLPDWFGDVVFKVALLLILVLAGIIVFNELRSLRWRGRLARDGTGRVARERGPTKGPRTLADVRALPLAAQPGALLLVVIEQLVRSGQLPDRRDATNHELALRLHDRAPGLAKPFRAFVNETEAVVYGGRVPDASVANRLWHAAESLLAANASAATETAPS